MMLRSRSWRGLVVAAAVGAIGAVALVGWAAARSSRATVPPVAAWLMIESQAILPEATWDDRSAQLASFRQTQAHLIVSPNVLEAASKAPQVRRLVAAKADPVAWLQAGIKVDELSDQLLAVSMPGEPRADQAILVNAVLEAYLAATSDWESGRQGNLIERKVTALRDCKDKLRVHRQELHAVPPPDLARAAAIEDAIKVSKELAYRLSIDVELSMMKVAGEPIITLIAQARP